MAEGAELTKGLAVSKLRMDPVKKVETLLELPGDLIAHDPDELKNWLLAAFAARQPTILSGRNVTRIGTAALQLLVAFRRDAAAQGMTVELRDASQPLLDAVACLGLTQAVGLAAPTA